MKKNKRISLGLLLIIVALAIWISTHEFGSGSTLSGDGEYDFSVEDTASITRIELSDRIPSHITLERSGRHWTLNGEYRARQDAVDELLNTLNRMEMRNIPSDAARNSILARMGTYGREVKIYAGDELIKHFIVGTDNPDQLGTYMMKADGRQPYAVYIPGFNGFLSTRFFTREDLWRDRTIFGVDNLNVRRVEMIYEVDPGNNFIIEQNENGELSVSTPSGEVIDPFHAQHTRFFLGALRTLQYEGAIIPDDKVWAKQDSVKATMPVFELRVTDHNNETQSLTAYYVPPEPDTYDNLGRPMTVDPDHFYAFLGDGRFVLIQTYAFENILKSRSYFELE